MSDLSKKVTESIKVIRMAYEDAQVHKDSTLELAYSGGKDSEVLRNLAELACVPYHAIYKDTTIDESGTHPYIKARGVDIYRPKKTFFQEVERNGFPTRLSRWCCRKFKEYKVHDVVMLGVRREESVSRSRRYVDYNQCRLLGSHGTHHQSQWFPLLNWTAEDIMEFVRSEGIQLLPVYYGEDGTLQPNARHGCLGCPLRGDCGRSDFKRYPILLRRWLKAGIVWWSRTNGKCKQMFPSIAHVWVRNVHYRSYDKWREDGFADMTVEDVLAWLSERYDYDYTDLIFDM